MSDAVPLLPAAEGDPSALRVRRAPRAHVLFSDGSWRTCRVIGWAQDTGRRWLVLVGWPDGSTGWHVYDPRYIHEALAGLRWRCDGGRSAERRTPPHPARVAGVVAELWRYPVKPMPGERCEQAGLEDRGLRGDRLYAVRDGSGKFGSGKDTRRFRGDLCRDRRAWPDPPRR